MIIGRVGAISVVPYFATGPVDLTTCSVNVLEQGGRWRELSPDEVESTFDVRRPTRASAWFPAYSGGGPNCASIRLPTASAIAASEARGRKKTVSSRMRPASSRSMTFRPCAA